MANSAHTKDFETVPTFYPTLSEMLDFDSYLKKLKDEHACDKVGLTKIVPPSDWGWNPTREQASGLCVKNPIQQCVVGRSGVYNVCNVVKRDMSFEAYEALALAQTSAPSDDDLADPASVDRSFWKSLTTTAKAPLYGSDVEGTLFGDAPVAFNVNTLECCLKRAGVHIPGVTNPYMYVGMWRSFFPFHTEDVNM
jgi:jumonji domain-containing protein 2